LPWEDRLFHKNWKVRNEANIDLASLCDSITDPKDSRIREFGRCFLSSSPRVFKFSDSLPDLPVVDLDSVLCRVVIC